ncbi:MAG: alpha/beta hydrolase, partial [Bacteroidales bacterium]|nr:alpha/beta hydrolase [Bacteroidales bacterium]
MIKKYILIISLMTISMIGYSQNYRKIKDIPYASHRVSHKQALDLYIPESDGAMPCLIWIHGGAWLAGSKDGLPREVDMLPDHGYVVASIGYRLSSEAIFPAQIFDCKAAIRFLKANAGTYGIDPNKMAVSGSSAGGHLVALLGTSCDIQELEGELGEHLDQSSCVQAVCDFFGPTDLLALLGQRGENARRPMAEDALLGGP